MLTALRTLLRRRRPAPAPRSCDCSPHCRAGEPELTHNCRVCGTWAGPHAERDCPEFLAWAQGDPHHTATAHARARRDR